MPKNKPKGRRASAAEPPVQRRRKHSIVFTEPSLARPSFAAECDIHKIVDRFQRTGMLPQDTRQGEPRYGDAPAMTMFEAACIHAEMRSRAESAALEPEPAEDTPSDALRASESDDLEKDDPTYGSEAPEAQKAAQEERSHEN